MEFSVGQNEAYREISQSTSEGMIMVDAFVKIATDSEYEKSAHF